MRYSLVGVTIALIFLIKPGWPAALVQLRADYVAEEMQGIVDRMISNKGQVIENDPTPVAPGKMRQLRQDMRQP